VGTRSGPTSTRSSPGNQFDIVATSSTITEERDSSLTSPIATLTGEYRGPGDPSLNCRRARGAFGAAHAFPIRERYLLSATSPPTMVPSDFGSRSGSLTARETGGHGLNRGGTRILLRFPDHQPSSGSCGRSGPNGTVAYPTRESQGDERCCGTTVPARSRRWRAVFTEERKTRVLRNCSPKPAASSDERPMHPPQAMRARGDRRRPRVVSSGVTPRGPTPSAAPPRPARRHHPRP
jgi:hypothetical protein